MKNLEEINLEELSSWDKENIQGGDTVVSYTDSQGYSWHYYYNDAGNLTGVCCGQGMRIL